MWVFAIIVFVIGIWNILLPYSAWYLHSGWKYKDSEPTEFALAMYRVGGVVSVIVSVAIWFGFLE